MPKTAIVLMNDTNRRRRGSSTCAGGRRLQLIAESGAETAHHVDPLNDVTGHDADGKLTALAGFFYQCATCAVSWFGDHLDLATSTVRIAGIITLVLGVDLLWLQAKPFASRVAMASEAVFALLAVDGRCGSAPLVGVGLGLVGLRLGAGDHAGRRW